MNFKKLIKLILSLLMLGLVLRMVDFSTLKETLLSIPISVAIIVVIGYLVGQVLSAYKWWLIARNTIKDCQYNNALKSYFIGMFVNCFGFGIVGGDVTRAVLITDGKSSKTAALASVVADRAHGLAILALLGTICTLLFGLQALDTIYVLILSGIGLILVLGWYLGPSILLKIVPKDKKLYDTAQQVSRVFPKDFKTVLIISLISCLFHLLQIVLHWIMGMGMGVDLSWSLLLVAIPFVNILSSLPISWNGLGVRENAYVFFLSASLSKEQAIAFGAIWLLAVTFSSAVGGIVSILTKDMKLAQKAKITP